MCIYTLSVIGMIFISCARACTVASEVFTEAQSFADCKLHIRTRLLALAFSNFWKHPTSLLVLCAMDVDCQCSSPKCLIE